MQISTRTSLLLLSLCLLLGCSGPRYDQANGKACLCAAAPHNTCDWMKEMMLAHPARHIALADICLPGSHDAGMYTTQHCSAFANTGNTQTQYLNMQHQLEAGLRLFDVRPELLKGHFYTLHSTHCDGLGCRGDDLDSVLRQTRRFVDSHAEIVFLYIGHYCHTGPFDSAMVAELTQTLGDRIYTETEKSPTSFIHTPLEQIVPAGSGTGKVVLLMEGVHDLTDSRAKGWFSQDLLVRSGGWSNDNEYPLLEEHQLRRFADYRGNGASLFELAWQLTQHTPQAVRTAFSPHSLVTIRRGAMIANAHLPQLLDSLISTHMIRKGNIPNIIWGDMVDTMITQQCIRLSEVNLK